MCKNKLDRTIERTNERERREENEMRLKYWFSRTAWKGRLALVELELEQQAHLIMFNSFCGAFFFFVVSSVCGQTLSRNHLRARKTTVGVANLVSYSVEKRTELRLNLYLYSAMLAACAHYWLQIERERERFETCESLEYNCIYGGGAAEQWTCCTRKWRVGGLDGIPPLDLYKKSATKMYAMNGVRRLE